MGAFIDRPVTGDLPISRRGFLVRSAGLSALLALGGCTGRQEEEYRRQLGAGERPSALPVREYVVLRAVAGRMLAVAAGDAASVTARVDHELTFHPPRLRADFRDALRLVEWWPVVTRLTRFTRLSESEQNVVLGNMATSRLDVRRSAFQGLKMLVMFFQYTRRETWEAIGYDGPWVERGPERIAYVDMTPGKKGPSRTSG